MEELERKTTLGTSVVQILKVGGQSMILQYSVEPNILIDLSLGSSSLEASEELFLASFEYVNRVGRWPREVLSRVTNVRGGYCCVVSCLS